MDPAAHFLTGAFLAKAVSRERSERLLFWTLGIAAMIPDLDVVFSPWGTKLYWLYHRGFTHSFLGGALLAVPFGYFLWKRGVRPLLSSFLLSVGSVWIHVVGDWSTSFGTPIFMPFDDHNCSLDIVSNFNWIFFLIGMGVLWYLRDRDRHSRLVIGVVMTMLLAYQLAGRTLTQRLLKEESSFDVIPHLVKPHVWRAHVADQAKREYRLYHVWPFIGEKKLVLSPPLYHETSITLAARKDPLVKLFFKHNRWPVAEEEKTQNGWLVRFSNLLYYWRGRWGERIEVELTPELEIVRSRKVFQVTK